MVPTAGLPVHSSLCQGHWSPRPRRGGEAVQGCSDQEVVGGDGSAFRMWTAPLKPGWMPPPAAGASAVALHQWTAVSSEWMSPSGLSSPGHTCIPEAPLDGQHSSPQSAQAQSKTRTNPFTRERQLCELRLNTQTALRTCGLCGWICSTDHLGRHVLIYTRIKY